MQIKGVDTALIGAFTLGIMGIIIEHDCKQQRTLYVLN